MESLDKMNGNAYNRSLYLLFSMANNGEPIINQQLNQDQQQQLDRTDQTRIAEHDVVQQQRNTVVRRLERWIAQLDQPEFAQMDYHDAQTRKAHGEGIMHQMEEMQLDVVRAAVSAGLNIAVDYGNEFMELEERYFNATVRLNRRIAELIAAAAPRAVADGEAAPAAGANNQQKIVVQVPPQQHNMTNTWGTFDGRSLYKWKEFKQRFSAAIHNNEHVSTTYKFTYLKNSLKNKASELIARYESTDENYEAAWDRLNSEYDRKYPLARAYLERFLQLKEISDPATADELRHLSNVTMETVQNLNSIGYPVDQWNMVFVHVLHALLNAKLSYEWNMELKDQHNDEPTVANIVEFIDKRASAAINVRTMRSEIVVVTNNDRAANSKDQRNNSRNSSATRSTSGAAHGSADGSATASDQKWKYPCGSCNKDHKIYFCPEFTALSYDARVADAKKKGLCVLCLKRGHGVENCYDSSRCRDAACSGNDKHNSWLCPQKKSKQLARPANMEQPRQKCPASTQL